MPDRGDEARFEKYRGIETKVENGTNPQERLRGSSQFDYLERTVTVRWADMAGGKKVDYVKEVKVGMLKNTVWIRDVNGEKVLYLVEAVTTEGRRGNNEDCAAVYRVDENRLVLTCDDGHGGREAGEVASSQAVAVVEQDKDNSSAGRLMEKAAAAVTVGSTTADIVVIEGNNIDGAHVGDGRVEILYAGEGVMDQLTEDHSLIQEKMDEGEGIDPDTDPRRNIVTRSLGTRNNKADEYNARLGLLDTLFIFSDGVVDALGHNLGTAEFRGIGREPEDLFNFVEKMLIPRRSRDNITIIMVRRLEEPRE